MIFQTKAKVVKNIEVARNYYNILLSCGQIAKGSQPGQFVNIRLTDTPEPLLRRPFSIHQVNGSKIEILYEVVGKGTELLSQKKQGEYLDIIGPLGNGFSLDEQTLLVAGGMGVAPLIFLAEKLAKIQNPKSKIQNIVLIGARTKKQILCEKEFKKLSCDVKISTDDGSQGYKGKVTDLLKKILSTLNPQPSTICACGPQPMLKEVANISKKYNISAQVSLEEHMVCGIGACLGCVVNTREGYKRVCKEGPVFNADEIIW
jgi:dihydroorotate dehydrogenase electron transfer subunit